MYDVRASGMRDLTAYAPIRVALTGIWRIVFGLLLAIPAGALIWIGPNGEPGAPRAAGDLAAVVDVSSSGWCSRLRRWAL